LWRRDRPSPFYSFSSLVVRSLRMHDSSEKPNGKERNVCVIRLVG
jgi:hypothetical protein